jgi:hypothetical protein
MNDLCVMNLSELVPAQQVVVRETGLGCTLSGSGSELLFLTLPKTDTLTSTSQSMTNGAPSWPAIVAPPRRLSETEQGTYPLSLQAAGC